MPKKIKEKIIRLKKWIFVEEIKKTLLRIYIFILLLGLILTFIYVIFPKLEMCFSLFNQEYCTTWGIFLILFFSIPGYFIAGNILYFIPNLPWFLSFVIIIFVSGLFYYFLGYLFDAKRNKKFNTEFISKIVIYISILILILILLSTFVK